jgi:hypothetical protein
VSVAGLRPGLGRGGITHSLRVTIADVGSADVAETSPVLGRLAGLIARAGWLGARGIEAAVGEGEDNAEETILVRR